MIKILKTDRGNRSILLEISNLTAEQHFEVGDALCRGDSDSYDCGPYVMVCCGEFVTFDDMVEHLESLQKKYACADIFVKEVRDNEGVSTTTEFSEVDVALCEFAQDCFYDRPTAKFSADIWTDPTYGGTGFHMESIDDYGWSASTEKFLDVEEVKKIMLGYINQLPEDGASEENWKAYFGAIPGFETMCE